MYCLIVYDVPSHRCNHLHKVLTSYLNWVQNSVFEGELSKGGIKELTIAIADLEIDGGFILLYSWSAQSMVDCKVLQGVKQSKTIV